MQSQKLFTAEFSAKRVEEIEGENAVLNVILGSCFIHITIFGSPQNCNILAFCSRNYLTGVNSAVNFFHRPVFRPVPRTLGNSHHVSNSHLLFSSV